MVGWVAFKVSLRIMLKLKPFKIDDQCLFLAFCASCSACEKSFLTGKECSCGDGGRGIGEGMRENNAYCFVLRMAHLLTFIYNSGIWKGTIQPRIKNGTHFSCYESVPSCSKRIQCSNEFMFHSNMRCYVTQWPATRFCGAATPSSEKIAFDSPVKIAFRRFLFADDTNLFFSLIDFPH